MAKKSKTKALPPSQWWEHPHRGWSKLSAVEANMYVAAPEGSGGIYGCGSDRIFKSQAEGVEWLLARGFTKVED